MPSLLQSDCLPCPDLRHPNLPPISSFRGAAKFAALEEAGVYISRSPAQLGSTMVRAFKERGMTI